MLKSILLASAIAFVVVGNASAADKWTDEENLAGLKKTERVRYALSGQPIRIMILYALNVDCSPMEGYQRMITKAPEHGTAEIVPFLHFPNFAKETPRYKCNEKQIQAQALVYKPNDNYEGPDSLTYLELNPSGFAEEEIFTFNVRAFKDKPKPAAKAIDGGTEHLPPAAIRPKSK